MFRFVTSFAVFLTLAANAIAAVGDILSVTIPTEGWCADIVVAGFTSGATYPGYGLGANNDPATGTPKITFNITSMSFDDTGTPTTRARQSFGTTNVRVPYASATIAGTFTSGTFLNGEVVTQATSLATAVVVGGGQSSGTVLRVKAVLGIPDNSHTWTGNTSTATLAVPSLPVAMTIAGSKDELYDGTNLKFRVPLSEPIYAKDTTGAGNSGADPTVTILAGLVTNSGGLGQTSNAVTNLTVTNNSTLAYPRVVGNWFMPNYEKVGSTQRLRCGAFHGHAQQGRQVRCVKFTSADTHSHTLTTILLAPVVDLAFGDAVPIVEYIADFDTSGHFQNDVGTANFKAYPWIGDSTSVLDTSDGVNTIAPLYAPQHFICDPGGTYCKSVAVVDASVADDLSGVVTVSFNSASPPASYKTISAAYNALRTYNNTNYSRNNCGGSIIYLKDNAGAANNFNWIGGTPTIGTDPDCSLEIKAFPGTAVRQNININAFLTTKSVGKRLKMSGVYLTANATLFDVNLTGTTHWFDQCEFNTTTAAMISRVENWYLTRCLMTQFSQNITPFSTNNGSPAIIRGNTLIGVTGCSMNYVFIGNLKTNATSLSTNDSAGGGTPTMANQVYAFNRLTTTFGGNPLITLKAQIAETHGLAVVQNVFESTNSSSSPLVQISADTSSAVCNNVIFHHNVCVGQRTNVGYNENGATPFNRLNWSFKNNIVDDYNIKSDTFSGNTTTSYTRFGSSPTFRVDVVASAHQYVAGDIVYVGTATSPAVPAGFGGVFTVAASPAVTGTTFSYFTNTVDPGGATATTKPPLAPNPFRTGNWMFFYGVSCSGNLWAETTGVGSAGSFMQEFQGVKSIAPSLLGGEPPGGTPNVAGYIKFVNRQSYTGAANGAGNGDYHLKPDSPAVNLQRDFILPFDIEGNPRSSQDAAGAYSMSRQRALLLAP